ncbi:hypothetical protein AAFF_G00238180 [Aldrovandia affinis]|uniref:Leucine-rich repeat-containing protein 71 n=1 Tax=Aldrovandia affinis TaxID=143900 RepID=A0AAD7W3Y5_9TELE|nr:hypothetical protein AAFF_G00238180 [Aldrovandia affinis]
MKKRGVKTPKDRRNSGIEDDPSRVAGLNVQDKSPVQSIDDYQCCGSLDVDFPEVCALLGMTEIPEVTLRPRTTGSQTTEQSPMEGSQSNVTNGAEPAPWVPKPRLHVELEIEEDPCSAREVRVLGWKVDESIARAMNKTLPSMSNLQRLHLWRVGLTERTLTSLKNTVSLCHSLRTVALEGTPLPEQCFHLLMAEDSKLVHLSLRNNRIGEEGARLIGRALSTPRTANGSLLSLNLTFNPLGDAGAEHIAKGLRLNRTLLCLSLGSNHIGDVGAGYLAEVLGPFTLNQEEIVERRRLLGMKDLTLSADSKNECPASIPSSSSLDRNLTKGSKTASKRKSPPKKEEKHTPNQVGGAAGKKEEPKLFKKGLDTKLETAEVPERVSPLLDTEAQHSEGRVILPGNNVLTALNLSGNRLTEQSLHLFLKAVKEQDEGGGLLRLSLSRNCFPLLNCDTYLKIQEVMKRKDPLNKNLPGPLALLSPEEKRRHKKLAKDLLLHGRPRFGEER